MSNHHKEADIPVVPADKSKIKKIWMVAAVLAIITTIEYIIAFTVPAAGLAKDVRNVMFILLTVLKAYYIMSEFMHLGHEEKSLQRSIVFPLVFLAWLVLSQLMESSFILEALQSLWGY